MVSTRQDQFQIISANHQRIEHPDQIFVGDIILLDLNNLSKTRKYRSFMSKNNSIFVIVSRHPDCNEYLTANFKFKERYVVYSPTLDSRICFYNLIIYLTDKLELLYYDMWEFTAFSR